MALVAALLLVLQTVAAAFALGTGAATVPRDAFGNPLCVTSGDHDAQQAPAGPQHSLPGCCDLACGLSGPAVVPPPDPPVLAAPLVAAPVSAGRPVAVPVSRPVERSPANPRAPPLS